MGALAVFARYPRLGAVKTRLAHFLSKAGCLQLHCSLLWDTVERTSALAVDRYLFLADCSTDELCELKRKEPLPAWKLRLQQGRDLGERLLNAHQHLCGSHRNVAFLGSDSPTVPLGWIERAFRRLSRVSVVIGPTTDGGYYLLGLSEPRPQLFEGIDWGTERVLQQTRQKVPPDDLELLEAWYDIDVPEDLTRLREELDCWPPGRAGFPDRSAEFLNRLARIQDQGGSRKPAEAL